jgi:purine-cytosine permease-like protein
MGYGGGIGLIVVGLILALAVNEEQIGPVNVGLIGWILTLAGVLLLVLAIVQNNSKRTHTTAATTTHADGTQTTEQRSTERQDPPPAV